MYVLTGRVAYLGATTDLARASHGRARLIAVADPASRGCGDGCCKHGGRVGAHGHILRCRESRARGREGRASTPLIPCRDLCAVGIVGDLSIQGGSGRSDCRGWQGGGSRRRTSPCEGEGLGAVALLSVARASSARADLVAVGGGDGGVETAYGCSSR